MLLAGGWTEHGCQHGVDEGVLIWPGDLRSGRAERNQPVQHAAQLARVVVARRLLGNGADNAPRSRKAVRKCPVYRGGFPFRGEFAAP